MHTRLSRILIVLAGVMGADGVILAAAAAHLPDAARLASASSMLLFHAAALPDWGAPCLLRLLVALFRGGGTARNQRDWLPQIEAPLIGDGVDPDTARQLATLVLAVLRGLHLDLVATGDVVVRLNPDQSAFWLQLGISRARAGQPQPAIEAFTRVLALGCPFPSPASMPMWTGSTPPTDVSSFRRRGRTRRR